MALRVSVFAKVGRLVVVRFASKKNAKDRLIRSRRLSPQASSRIVVKYRDKFIEFSSSNKVDYYRRDHNDANDA